MSLKLITQHVRFIYLEQNKTSNVTPFRYIRLFLLQGQTPMATNFNRNVFINTRPLSIDSGNKIQCLHSPAVPLPLPFSGLVHYRNECRLGKNIVEFQFRTKRFYFLHRKANFDSLFRDIRVANHFPSKPS